MQFDIGAMALASMESLQELRMANNQIGGEISSEQLEKLSSLRLIDLSCNQMHGKLPRLTGLALEHVNFSCNAFSGEIPPEFQELRGLNFLSLGENRCRDVVSSYIVIPD